MQASPPVGRTLEQLGTAIPKVFYAGAVNAGAPFNASVSPGQGRCWVIQGIDVYATIQPNNGELQVTASSVNWPVPNVTILQIQQSQNFPGPFYWRGQLPLFFGNNVFTINSTQPFVFTVWGVSTYDFTLDGGNV